MRTSNRILGRSLAVIVGALAVASAACSGAPGADGGSSSESDAILHSPQRYSIGGTVTELANPASAGLVLIDDVSDVSLSITADGAFTFPLHLYSGSAYSVSVAKQPAGQRCMVSGGAGTIENDNVTSIGVECVPVATYPLTVSVDVDHLYPGLAIADATSGAQASLSAPGQYVLEDLPSGARYSLSLTQPAASQRCWLDAASGTVSGPTTVHVSCDPAEPGTVVVTWDGPACTGLGFSDGLGYVAIPASGTATFTDFNVDPPAYLLMDTTNDPTCTCTGSNGTFTDTGLIYPWHVPPGKFTLSVRCHDGGP